MKCISNRVHLRHSHTYSDHLHLALGHISFQPTLGWRLEYNLIYLQNQNYDVERQSVME